MPTFCPELVRRFLRRGSEADLPQKLTYGLPQKLTYSLAENLTYSLPQNLTYGLPQNLTYGLPQNLTYSLPSVSTYGFDEDFRLFRNDSIAVTAQSSHSGGSPINQRE